jgi:RNase H-fold protein (predicted Holliday junction resolvase)
MSQYGNEFTAAVQLARDQLKNPPTGTPTGTGPLDTLLQALSGVPQDAIMQEIAAAMTATSQDLATLVGSPKTGEGGGGGGGGGGGTVLRTAPEVIKRTATEASAPVIDTQGILDNAVTPNIVFNIGAVATVGIVAIIGELFSIGQIDKILEPLLSFLDLTDAPTVFQGVRNIKLRNQVLQPYEYYVNSHNPINIPPYSDLIRLRVREDRNGKPILTQDEFIQQMKYSGFAEWWSNALWDAHFTLPNNSELFTMYNYGIITFEELKAQMIINDIAPEWVEREAEIARRYPSMVELRMMARRNPMPAELVQRTLKAQGVREEFFPYFQSMFIDWDVDAIRGRRQTRIVAAYEEGILSDDEFRTVVKGTAASTNETEELLLEAQWRRFMRRLGERQKTIVKLLQKNLITRPEAEQVLSELGYEPVDIDHWLDYAVATMGFVPEVEGSSEEGITGLESQEARALKFGDWEKLTPPIYYPIFSESPPEE